MAAPTYGDRVQETFTTTGTGAITLAGAVTGYQAFSSVVPNAGQCYYAATDGTNWEVGLGTYATSGNTLTRTQILSSSNAGAAVNWAAGTKTIYLDFPAFAAASIVPAFNAITGFLPSAITGSSTTGSLTVAAGQAAESLNTKYITKASTTSWAVSNGNALNGYQGGTTLPNSSSIHFYSIEDVNGLNQGVFASLSATAPTLPSTHTGGKFRRIFSLVTTSAGALRSYVFNETAGGAIQVWLDTPTADITAQTPTTANRTLYTLASVPTGVKMQPTGRGMYVSAAASYVGIYTSPDEVDVAPSAFNSAAAPGYDVGSFSTTAAYISGVYTTKPLLTNVSSQIGYRANSAAAGTLTYITAGFVDFRRA